MRKGRARDLAVENMNARLAFGAALRTAREERGITTDELAAQIGCHGRNVINTAEREGLTPRSSYFFKLCKLLKLKPEDYGFVGDCLTLIALWREGGSPDTAPEFSPRGKNRAMAQKRGAPRVLDEVNKAAALKFGCAVKAARTELGVNAREMARILRITHSAMLQIERVGATPKSRCFFPLCAELGLNPEEFGFTDYLADLIESRETD